MIIDCNSLILAVLGPNKLGWHAPTISAATSLESPSKEAVDKQFEYQKLKNKQAWDKLTEMHQRKQKALREVHEGTYPKNATGFYDFQHFENEHFERLRSSFQLSFSIKYQIASDVAGIETIGVDSELVEYINAAVRCFEKDGKV